MKILSPVECVEIVRKAFLTKGYALRSRSKSSYYFAKNGCGRKIRVSDHIHDIPYYDVFCSVVFLTPTIENDVIYQVEKSIRNFENRFKNKFVRK